MNMTASLHVQGTPNRLALSTLKSQIVGNQKPHILNLLYNVEDLDECWEVLGTHYGDIKTVLPRLSEKLGKLPHLPQKSEALLNYWKTAKAHKKEESINYDYIQRFSKVCKQTICTEQTQAS